ncbi:D-hexose-6-phosphate mutarotase [Neptunomonas antarctica]|uniref:Putative glucose-6-phosphate 1-epimerase n=1 Tax=Neptunomonas antarctica TaxID=619304 RepID=A0A1N7PNU4_9GAMM|nr:D-hexose-6-phosphate mutarotase [Neptunomonas antarctica]SIT12323.1 glucose-6-phosphate 1-epimerase [Neptunomonas antarctica]
MMKYAFCQQTKRGELDSLEINHPLFKATILLQGAQIIEFSPAQHDCLNALWLSPSAHYKSGESVRGGIPICWPWFGAADKNPASVRDNIRHPVAHGFARSRVWQLKHIKESCHQVEIVLRLSSDADSHEYWPYDFELEAKFILGKTLTLFLITHNTDHRIVNLTQALHTYLPTSDINCTYINGANNTCYIDAMDQWRTKSQQGNIHFNTETDRLYLFNQSPILQAFTPHHKLTLHNFNSRSAVIWNPWTEKSKRLSQFNATDFKTMFCIETANVLEDSVTLAPNTCHQIGMQLIIES